MVAALFRNRKRGRSILVVLVSSLASPCIASLPEQSLISVEAGASLGASSPVALDPASDGKVTGELYQARVDLGGQVRAGGTTVRDSTGRLAGMLDLGLADRGSVWSYDGRGRLSESRLSRPVDEILQTLPIRSEMTDADVIVGRDLELALGQPQLASLGDAARDVLVADWTVTEGDGHAVAEQTFFPGAVESTTILFDQEGGRRIQQGSWTFQWDRFERLTSMQSVEEGRRIDYVYDPNDRVARRIAKMPVEGGEWAIETRSNVLARDTLPADTVWFWDPITDRLLAVWEHDPVGEAGLTQGLIRQFLHGDRGYDDPLMVVGRASEAETPVVQYPLLDEAATGSVTAVLDADGNVIERTLYADSWGDAPRYLHGAIVDGVSIETLRNDEGDLVGVDLRVHFSEPIDYFSLDDGMRFRSRAGSATELAPCLVYLVSPAEAGCSLTGAEWTAFAATGEELEIVVTESLRAEGWSGPVAEAPWWAVELGQVEVGIGEPVIVTRSFAMLEGELFPILVNGVPETLYEIEDLYLAASPESRSLALTGFKAAPFVEPATELVYLRARWYDASTGSFLSPDPMGYADSSNLYAYAAGDPVNLHDPTGEILPVIAAAAAYVGWTVINTGIDVFVDYAFHLMLAPEGEEFDLARSIKTNLAINALTASYGGKIKHAGKLRYLRNPMVRAGLDIAITGTVDMVAYDQSALEAYGSAAIGRGVAEGIGAGGRHFFNSPYYHAGVDRWYQRGRGGIVPTPHEATAFSRWRGNVVHRTRQIERDAKDWWRRLFKKTNGNTLSDDVDATLYALFDADGNFLKWGITQHIDPRRRYSLVEVPLEFEVRPIHRGSRRQMAEIERWLVETRPGALNRERWAGWLDPTHWNYRGNR